MPVEYATIYLDSQCIAGRAIDVFTPDAGVKCQNVGIFMIHGGGWRSGHREIYHQIMRQFTKKGFLCASCGYRTGPSVTAFQQLFDIRCGYQLFTQKLSELTGGTGKVVVFGSSAGGHLGLLLSMTSPGGCGENLRELGDIEINDAIWQPPAGVVASCAPVTFEPWEDIFPPIWGSMTQAAGKPYLQGAECYKRLSPSRYVSKNLPPVFLMLAEKDHMFPAWLAENFAEALRGQNVDVTLKIYPNAEHGFLYSLDRKVQRQAFFDLLDFISKVEKI